MTVSVARLVAVCLLWYALGFATMWFMLHTLGLCVSGGAVWDAALEDARMEGREDGYTEGRADAATVYLPELQERGRQITELQRRWEAMLETTARHAGPEAVERLLRNVSGADSPETATVESHPIFDPDKRRPS